MENIYSSPKSDLNNPNEKLKRSIWWKIYFFVITVLSIAGMSTYLVADGAGFVDFVETILVCIGTAGLFGFVFNQKVIRPGFWLPFLIFYIISGFIYEPLSNVDMRQGLSDVEYYVLYGIGLVLSLPAYWALYLYGKSDNQPWKTT